MDNGAIAFLDILGFKGIWKRENPQNVLDIMKGAFACIEATYKKPPPEKKWPPSQGPDVTILSDTIVVGFRSDHPACLLLIANVIYSLFHYFIKSKLFFRGAISYGQYAQAGNTFLGPAIDDVASWYQASKFIGTVTTPRTNYFVDRLSPMTMSVNSMLVPSYLKYNVPGIDGANYYLNCLNWPGFLQASYDVPPKAETKSEARRYIEKIYTEQEPFDDKVLNLYENTLNFIDFCVSR